MQEKKVNYLHYQKRQQKLKPNAAISVLIKGISENV